VAHDAFDGCGRLVGTVSESVEKARRYCIAHAAPRRERFLDAGGDALERLARNVRFRTDEGIAERAETDGERHGLRLPVVDRSVRGLTKRDVAFGDIFERRCHGVAKKS
jgi:hypothetical protein